MRVCREGELVLRHAGAADAGGAHLSENLVQPLQGPVEVQLDPAGGAGHSLTPGGRTELIYGTMGQSKSTLRLMRNDSS